MAESWLDLILRATKDFESPERFFWWSGIAAISAIVKKGVWIDRGSAYRLYPNVYVLLVSARSGLRKGLPVSYVSSIMRELEVTRLVQGRGSVQGFIKEFSMQRTLPSGRVLSNAQGLLIAPEFDAFLVEDPKVFSILTQLYNTHENDGKWENTLKNSPVESLKEPCISLLAASNEPLLNSLMKAKDIEGGFIARTFIVHESKMNRINSLVDPPDKIVTRKELAEPLKRLIDINGEFRWERKEKDLFKSWYEGLMSANYRDRTGTIDRLGDSALKIAMLIHLARDNELVLTSEDIQEAISKTEECMSGISQVTMSGGASEIAAPMARVLQLLLRTENHQLTRQKILQKLYPDIDHFTLDKVVDTLTASGAIEAFRSASGQGVVYVMPERIVEQYKNFKKEEPN